MKAFEVCGYFGRLLFIALVRYKTIYTLFIQFLPKHHRNELLWCVAVVAQWPDKISWESRAGRAPAAARPSPATITNLFGKSHFHQPGHYRAVAARQQNTAWNNSLQMPGTGSFREKNESHSLFQWHKPLIQQSRLDRELRGQEGT